MGFEKRDKDLGKTKARYAKIGRQYFYFLHNCLCCVLEVTRFYASVSHAAYGTLFNSNENFRNFVKLTYFLPLFKLANSKWLADRVKALTGEEIKLLYPGIEHDVFYPRNVRSEDKIDILALGKGGWKILGESIMLLKW